MLVYSIRCTTGCTCCKYENHFRGLYKSIDEAKARIARFRLGVDNPLSSQYAKYGRYSIFEHDAEEISNDRLIIDDKVFTKKFIQINIKNGELINYAYKDETLTSDDYLNGRLI